MLKASIAIALAAAFLGGCSQGSDIPAASETHEVAAATALATSDADAASAPSAPAEDFALTCTNPVRLGASVAEVRKQFGADARIETLAGAEGIEYQALVLWGGDPTRRLELPFDETQKNPTVDAVTVGSDKARWRVEGLALKDPLARVAEANGKPFKLYGFGWDYGGNVSDWQGGALAGKDGCAVSIQLRPGDDAGEGYAAGDGSFMSNDPKVAKARAVIDALGVVRGD